MYSLCILICTGSYATYKLLADYKESETVYSELKEEKKKIVKESNRVDSSSNDSDTDNAEDDSILNNEYTQLFSKYSSLNSDYIGWITVPNTTIDYPVVMGESSYYLKHNFNKQEDNNGSIFTEYVDNPFLRHKTVLHGHHMKDGSMFAQLKLYRNKNFYNSSRNITILTNDRKLTYRVFSIFTEDAVEENYRVDFEDEQDFITHCKYLESKSMYPSNESFSLGDSILMLSTCSYETDISRLVVCAKLVQ